MSVKSPEHGPNRRLHVMTGGLPIIVMTRSAAETLAVVEKALEADFRLAPLQLREAPIFMAVAWPRYDGAAGLKPRLPAGRGLTLQQAMLSAGAEALELRASLARNHAHEFPALREHDGQPMVMATDLLRGDSVAVPARAVFLDFNETAGDANGLDAGADSTGCAAGMDRGDATCRALLECIERDAVALWWHGGMQCAGLPLELIDGLQPRLSWWLQDRPRRTVLLDLDSETGVPAVAAVSSEADGTAVALGTAASLDLADAVLAAVTEMIQTEAAMQQAAAAGDPELAIWLERGPVHRMIQFQPLAAQRPRSSGRIDMDTVLRGLDYTGHRALAVDLTLPRDPLPTMRVIVPGFCAMGGRVDPARLETRTGRRIGLAQIAKESLLEPF